MNLIFIAAGILLLFLGRKLFWLFVAVVGFLLGLTYAPQLLSNQPQSVILTISLITGLLGALLAALLQKLAVGLGRICSRWLYRLLFAAICGCESWRIPMDGNFGRRHHRCPPGRLHV